eukprot:3160682-Prorocentrum_lima.AAC.1
MTLLVPQVRCTYIEEDDDLHRHLRVNVCPVVLTVGVELHVRLGFEFSAPGVPVAVPCQEGGPGAKLPE